MPKAKGPKATLAKGQQTLTALWKSDKTSLSTNRDKDTAVSTSKLTSPGPSSVSAPSSVSPTTSSSASSAVSTTSSSASSAVSTTSSSASSAVSPNPSSATTSPSAQAVHAGPLADMTPAPMVATDATNGILTRANITNVFRAIGHVLTQRPAGKINGTTLAVLNYLGPERLADIFINNRYLQALVNTIAQGGKLTSDLVDSSHIILPTPQFGICGTYVDCGIRSRLRAEYAGAAYSEQQQRYLKVMLIGLARRVYLKHENPDWRAGHFAVHYLLGYITDEPHIYVMTWGLPHAQVDDLVVEVPGTVHEKRHAVVTLMESMQLLSLGFYQRDDLLTSALEFKAILSPEMYHSYNRDDALGPPGRPFTSETGRLAGLASAKVMEAARARRLGFPEGEALSLTAYLMLIDPEAVIERQKKVIAKVILEKQRVIWAGWRSGTHTLQLVRPDVGRNGSGYVTLCSDKKILAALNIAMTSKRTEIRLYVPWRFRATYPDLYLGLPPKLSFQVVDAGNCFLPTDVKILIRHNGVVLDRLQESDMSSTVNRKGCKSERDRWYEVCRLFRHYDTLFG